MTTLAPLLQRFFTDRLTRQRQASPATIAAYRDTFRLLLQYLQDTIGTQPCELDLDDLDADRLLGFLDHLQHDRGNSARTRNQRLAALRSFFRYAAFAEPGHLEQIQRVRAIPQKRYDKALISYLTDDEVGALVNAPDSTTWVGRRDRAFLLLAAQTGLRISELLSLNRADLTLGVGGYVHCQGKGRKERAVPLTTKSRTEMKRWLREDSTQPQDAAVFTTRSGRRLSRDAIERRITKHAATASIICASMAVKHVTAHVLRHSCAMRLLHAGVDHTVIAMWMGHEDLRSTQAYLHADMTIKERALARTNPIDTKYRRYHPTDPLLAFLEAL
jgi:integrase/recombinase XerD